MRRPELELKIRNIISFHYGLQLWAQRPELDELDSTEDFIRSLTDLMLGTKTEQEPVEEGRSPFISRYHPRLHDNLTIELNQKIGRKLKKLRERKGVSPTELAEKCDMTLEHYQKIENGESRFRFWEYELIMHELNLKSWLALARTSAYKKLTIAEKAVAK